MMTADSPLVAGSSVQNVVAESLLLAAKTRYILLQCTYDSERWGGAE